MSLPASSVSSGGGAAVDSAPATGRRHGSASFASTIACCSQPLTTLEVRRRRYVEVNNRIARMASSLPGIT